MVDRQGASSRGGGRKRPRVAAASAAPAAADGAAAVAVATDPFQQHEKYHVYQVGFDACGGETHRG